MQSQILQTGSNVANSPADVHSSPLDSVLGRAAQGFYGASDVESVKRDLQAWLVGMLTLAFSAAFLLVTLTMVLSLWLPAWVVALSLSAALAVLGLAVFASRQRGVQAISEPSEYSQTDSEVDEADWSSPKTQRAPARMALDDAEEVDVDEIIEVTETFVRRTNDAPMEARAATPH